MIKHRSRTQDGTTVILLIRHGDVENQQGVLYGRLPGFRLSALGIEQAKNAACLLRRVRLAALFSSPLLRCRQTAKEVLAIHPYLRLQISTRITEVLTPYQGMPGAVIDCLRGDIYTGVPQGYEQPADIVLRACSFLATVRQRYPHACTVAVTHGDVIAFVALWACGFTPVPADKLQLKCAGIFDAYPAHGSITMLTYLTNSPEERPQVTYKPSPEQICKTLNPR